MPHSAAMPPSADAATESSRLHTTSRLLRLADGDSAFTAQIRTMMWSEYCDVGAPLGRSEEGMLAWWDRELDG